MKFVIISNRLPVTLAYGEDGLQVSRSGGGLATGLDSLEVRAEKHWIGWPGLYVENGADKKAISHEL
jgi:Trehalose-6-phosphate synthase